MERALLVAVRFHEGRYHGAGGWPPAPARLFQALMAGAARGAEVPDAARDALDWLERLPPPVIAAPRGKPGKPYTSFVPNNDLDAVLAGKKALDIEDAVASVRVRKTVHPILFDPAAPLLYSWRFSDAGAPMAALCAMAGQLYQLGRGIDMAWANAAVLDGDEAQGQLSSHGGIVYHPSEAGGANRTLFCPRPGTRHSLTHRFEERRNRFRRGGSNRRPTRVFVQPPKPLLASVAYDAPPERLDFALRSGDARNGFASRPLAEAAALVAETRDQAAQRLSEALPARADDITRYLVGHGATDADKAARVRVVPVPSIGHLHADLNIRRLAVYVPQSCPVRADDLAWAFAQVSWGGAAGRAGSEVQTAADGTMTARYEVSARYWQSVTPLVLAGARRRRIAPTRDRAEAKGAVERAREEARTVHAVRQALRHAGVHATAATVLVQREPFDDRGECADRFSKGTRFPGEALWHVAVTFAVSVSGRWSWVTVATSVSALCVRSIVRQVCSRSRFRQVSPPMRRSRWSPGPPVARCWHGYRLRSRPDGALRPT